MKTRIKASLAIAVICGFALSFSQNCSNGFKAFSDGAELASEIPTGSIILTPDSPPNNQVSNSPLSPGQGTLPPPPMANNCNDEFINKADPYLASRTRSPFFGAAKILVSSSHLVLVNNCGVFVSRKNPINFVQRKDLNSNNSVRIDSLYLDDDLFYFANLEGFFQVNLTTGVFRRLLDIPKLQELQRLFPAGLSSVGLGISYGQQHSFAKGNFIFVQSSLGPIYSADGGQTWNIIKLYVSNYEIPGTITLRSLAHFKNKLFLGYDVGVDSVRVRSPQGLVTMGSAVSSIPKSAGVFSLDIGSARADHIQFEEHGKGQSLFADQNYVYALTMNFGMVVGSGVVPAWRVLRSQDGVSWQELYEVDNTVGTGFRLITVNGALYGLSQFMYNGLFSFATSFPRISSPLSYMFPEKLMDATEFEGTIYTVGQRGVYRLETNQATQVAVAQFSYPYCNVRTPNQIVATGDDGQSVSVLEQNDIYYQSSDAGMTFNPMTPHPSQYFPNYKKVSDVLVTGGGVTDSNNWFYLKGSDPAWRSMSLTEPLVTKDGQLIRVIKNSPSFGMYVAYDGVDLFPTLNRYSTSIISDAISDKGRVIVALFSGGIVTLENGNVIYSNTDIKQNGGGLWIKLYKIDNVIYAVGDRLWSSTNGGATFTLVPGAPYFPQSVFKLGSVHGISTIKHVFLSDSTLGNFRVIEACLK